VNSSLRNSSPGKSSRQPLALAVKLAAAISPTTHPLAAKLYAAISPTTHALVRHSHAPHSLVTYSYATHSCVLRKLLRAFAIAAAFSCGNTLNAQSALPLVRTIVDTSNQTIAHAVVTIHATDAAKTLLERTLTGANGRLSGISLAPGSYWMIVRRIGFKPDTQSLKISAGTTAAYTMVVGSIPIALPPILIEATQCTEFGALPRDSVLSHAWDLLETTIMSRAALYQDYEYEVATVDSSYSADRTPQWKVRTKTAHGQPSESRAILTFNEPLYSVTFRANKPNLQTGTEFGLLSNAFKANHCITLASDEANADVDVLKFESLPLGAKNFRVKGRVVIDRATSRMSHFSYSIFRNDIYVAHAYCTYGTTDVLGKAFPVITQLGLVLTDPKNGQIVSRASTSSTYREFKRVHERP